jgi:hypothetical protein
MMKTANASSGRAAEQNRRLRARLERLQRLFDAVEGNETADEERPRGPIVSVPGDGRQSFVSAPAIEDRDETRRQYVGEYDPRRRLLPYVGHANASVAELVTECIGLNLIGTSRDVWQNAVQQLQRTLDRRPGHTFVCVTDDKDIGYFIKRGITFEYIGYAHLLNDPDWKAYFRLNMELLKRKYGIVEFVAIAAGQLDTE